MSDENRHRPILVAPLSPEARLEMEDYFQGLVDSLDDAKYFVRRIGELMPSVEYVRSAGQGDSPKLLEGFVKKD
jgi:prophage DNA circulation protein